ncbi:MAG TPA: aldehyde dehydrogenase family protein [Acidimicrobiales bacterium]|nr:aldehyde dehydrogenase family protein [Acidimicrobiales bacterium]
MLRIEDPSTGELVGTIPESDESAVRVAVRTAREAWRRWRETPAAERGAALRTVAQGIKADAEGLARLNARETGKLINDARGGVAAAIGTIEQYAELGPLHRGKSLNGAWNATDLMVNERRRQVEQPRQRCAGGPVRFAAAGWVRVARAGHRVVRRTIVAMTSDG